jgi:uncharacterized membrane protein
MAEDPSQRETLERLIERLEHLEQLLQANTVRLHAIERRLGIEPAALPTSRRRPLYESLTDERDEQHAPTTQPPATVPPPQPVETRDAESVETHAWMTNEPTLARPSVTDEASGEATNGDAEHVGAHAPRVETNAPRVETDAPRATTPKKRDLESLIGGVWFAWAGIIAVVVTAALILKLAIENDWIGPGVRVALGGVGGLALLYTGERLRGRGLRQYAFILSGGGILILYLSIYAAFNFYHFIAQPVAFVLMALVTATAVALSVRQNALATAILGLVGGFATPILLSTGVDNQVALFTYVALLDAGVLAVAYFKRWRSLDFLSFLGTVLMTAGWADTFYTQEKLWPTVVFVSVFFVLYALLAVFHNTLARRRTRWFDVALLAANASLYFGFCYALLARAGYDHATPASHALLVSVFFTCLFYTVWRWNRDDRLLTYAYVGAAVVFLTSALAIQLELQWVTVAWAVEALMLLWIGLRSGETSARHAALAVFCAATVHWFAWDMREFAYGVDASFVPLLNRRALGCAVLVGALVAAARLYKRAPSVEEEERRTATTFFALAGSALGLTLLSLDVNDYFNARLANAPQDATDVRGRLENARQFSMTALWAFYGATALVLGLLKRITPLRGGALLLITATVGKLVAFDTSFYAASWHTPVFNQTFMAYAVVVLALAAGARFYSRANDDEVSERPVILPALVLAANVLALGALSLEALGFYDRAALRANNEGGYLELLEEGKSFALSVIWTLYGACAFTVGIKRRSRAWRYGGLLLLALTTFKLLVWDLGFYDATWHAPVFNRTFAGFALAVAALWFVARTYARSLDGAFEEGSAALSVVTVVANLLAIVALSAEAAGYFEARTGGALDERSLRDLELAKQLSLSVVWALYGGGLLIVGRMRRVRLLRLMSLVLLSLTTLKVFFWDLSSLDRVYRIISFIVLGAILLAVSYLYQKSQQARVAEEEAGQTS